MKPETWAYIIVSLVMSLLGLWGVVRTQSNKRLRNKLRRALQDNLAFYAIEELLCSEISTQNATLGTNHWSAIAVKRFYRAQLRADGQRTPSNSATPQKLTEELEKEGLV